ncbi:Lrp/AsnC family transcriptional regulator [Mumia zhuanghuii]|uniref:Lrp/AsnC family transcriptional regulator n=1 Tax=Mumia zhuanghuii TaxID=2585211 RepID=A0A5C4N3K6_9ACTN|nr:Lrp/AsnC family transcriptional regulator [Mumia zhuanghuii]TNC51419.1 Lrp/AsnC family transcriptional regulator [Mumia zhuanghuii]
MPRLDRLDAEIIGRLTRNARAGVVELATALGVARNTVQARLKRLEDSGVVRGFRPDVDLEAIGVPVQAFVDVELDQRRMAYVVKEIAQIPEVLEIITQAGREDLRVRVGAVTHADLQEVVVRIIDTDGVRHTTSTLAISTPLPYRVQPLLDKLTRESGYGRSTPAVE